LHLNSPLQRLTLATLFVAERCNSRCVTRDYSSLLPFTGMAR
jgi:hypothetical protein